ncbi:MAG TPA: methyltransferase domain-containing protein [Longimicrobiales bacterium]|nr:methyltransferase domain-containing protein [Longimicrobiales bacterium]
MTAPEHANTAEEERIVPGTALWETSYPDHIQRYTFALEYVAAGSRVLDAGCGVGYGAAEVADRRGAAVVAVDISAEALDLARRHFDRAAITWCRDDCQRLAEAAQHAPFDVIINFENIEHLAHPERFVERAADLLRPDGTLLTSTPNRLLLNHLRGAPADAPSTNQYHLNELSEAEFRTMLGRHFEHVELWYQSPAGSSRLRLLMHSAAVRLRVARPLRSISRWLRRLRPRGKHSGSRPPRLDSWTIARRDTGAAWTLIAVCRGPRRAPAPAAPPEQRSA